MFNTFFYISFMSIESKAWFSQNAAIDTITGKSPGTWTIELTYGNMYTCLKR